MERVKLILSFLVLILELSKMHGSGVEQCGCISLLDFPFLVTLFVGGVTSPGLLTIFATWEVLPFFLKLFKL
jgi:hypothetical protein